MTSERRFDSVKILVVSLLAVQLVSVVLAWTLNPIGQRSETLYALFLATDLIAFSVISYVNRTWGADQRARGGLLVAGSAVVLVLMISILFI